MVRAPGWGMIKRAGASVRHRLRTNAVVLMYHRVAEPPCDPWDIAVCPEHFEQQLEVLSALEEVISLGELRRDLKGGALRRSIVLTFDDGYRDNLTNAQPALERHGLPATVFVTTGALRHGGETMWWDPLGAAILHGQELPRELPLTSANGGFTWSVPEAPRADLSRWRAEPLGWRQKLPRPARAQLYLNLYHDLAARGAEERTAMLAQIADWARAAGVEVTPSPAPRTMTAGEVEQLSRCAGITIGSHTRSHSFLSLMDPAKRWEELAESKVDLQEVVGREVVDFSFPNGDVPADAAADLKRAGYETACTSRIAAALPDTDVFALPRLMVRDWDGERFARWLRRWGHG